ncbi:efflux transporter periplasmic adaptor subunit [Wenyingzhuangia fucanilytica]|uniref:Efflux transporter periplasmic adaptor subunit n=1 Tax=Wenyingzhuangia fucanilytica TaxID=1790137 RepID=A0A1B1Y7Q5_9FLAO|nr:efflux RND transporter periplasmic adaptor subunit [Wenyingzhuangia fucanilytica]ANW96769.1 efflux transporter periplasmic adaptor subunit [Wenyingzhuangia fucanilytica]
MKISITYIISSLLVLSILTSCKGATESNNHHEEESHEEHHETNTHLTKNQIASIGLKLGDFSKIKVNDYVKATGVLGLPPNAYAFVNAKSAGIVSGHKKFIEGNFINKNEIIAYLEHPDFIAKQQEFLITKAKLDLQKMELKRQQELMEAQAGVAKSLQTAKAELDILKATYMGLSQQLSYLGINTTSLSPDNIQKQIPIRSPMSGYITKINMHNGVFVQPSTSLMEIVADDHLHLELDVFEKDIEKIKVGQKISYTTPAVNSILYQGEISVIGKEFNSTSKTVRVHGHLEGKRPIFLKDLFINAKIWMNDITVNALPENAIINEGNNSFIYAVLNENDEETEFLKINIKTGATNNGYTQVTPIDKIPENAKIVTEGAYYVYAQSKNGELSHEH